METYSSKIQAVNEPWSINASNITGSSSMFPLVEHHQYRCSTCKGEIISLRGSGMVHADELLIDWELLLSELPSRVLLNTLEALEATYMTGLLNIPRMAAMGCSPIERRQGVFKWSDCHGGHLFATSMLNTIYICLCESFIHGRIREFLGAISGTMVFEEIVALDTTFVIIQEFTFRVKEFQALLPRS